MSQHCQYRGPNNEPCHGPKLDDCDFCYWHDSREPKTENDLIQRLEARAKTGEPMIGFSLRGADLSGINLVNKHKKEGFKLTNSDLYHCNLSKAHLFHIDLSNSSLMKADLCGANINCACLEGVNLLGVKLDGSKLDNIDWDKQITQEQQAKKASDPALRMDYYEQAEEIYRNLRKTTESQGLFELAGYFFQREMIMRRFQLPKRSLKRALSKIVDLFCGYGEEPARVVGFSLITILSFAFLFFFVGITDGESSIGLSSEQPINHNIRNFFQCLYFSVVTFTTLGYGDLSPLGMARAFAAIEAFAGSFILALFVVVFVKKMTR